MQGFRGPEEVPEEHRCSGEDLLFRAVEALWYMVDDCESLVLRFVRH